MGEFLERRGQRQDLVLVAADLLEDGLARVLLFQRELAQLVDLHLDLRQQQPPLRGHGLVLPVVEIEVRVVQAGEQRHRVAQDDGAHLRDRHRQRVDDGHGGAEEHHHGDSCPARVARHQG